MLTESVAPWSYVRPDEYYTVWIGRDLLNVPDDPEDPQGHLYDVDDQSTCVGYVDWRELMT
jgi:hypothetical protein